MEILLKNLLKI